MTRPAHFVAGREAIVPQREFALQGGSGIATAVEAAQRHEAGGMG